MIALRATALIAAGSLGLHELRYLIGYGSHAHDALAAQGHAYLPLVGIAAGILLALAAAQLMRLLAAAWRSGAGQGSRLPLGLAWLAGSVALAAVYTGQELIEGAVAQGHPGGIAAITAHGGLIAYPLALALGALIALALRGAEAVVAAVAARSRRRRGAGRRPRRARLPLRIDRIRPSALAAGFPVRGPPLVL